MLTYSDEGYAARPAFFAAYNEITIIVEDFNKENFYTVLINNLLQGGLRIKQVLGVGGKRQVFERFKLQNKAQNGKPEFFLVDGDFDELLALAPPDSAYFYRLTLYDIESYLVEENALCILAQEEHPTIAVEKYKELFQIDSWMAQVVAVSTRLVACAALLQEHEETQTGISLTVERYISGGQILPDESLIDHHIGQVRTAQSIGDAATFDCLLDNMITRMGGSKEERMRWISGKDIVVPLAMRMLRMHTARSLNKESFCFRLAKHCELPRLAGLRARILAAAEIITASAG